jgi:hypothetical protein
MSSPLDLVEPCEPGTNNIQRVASARALASISAARCRASMSMRTCARDTCMRESACARMRHLTCSVGPPQNRKNAICLRAVGIGVKCLTSLLGGKRARIEVKRNAPNARMRKLGTWPLWPYRAQGVLRGTRLLDGMRASTRSTDRAPPRHEGDSSNQPCRANLVQATRRMAQRGSKGYSRVLRGTHGYSDPV